MRYLISLYNRNRRFIWLLIALIAGVILLVQIINTLLKGSNQNQISSNNTTNYSPNYNTIVLETEKSGVTNKSLTISQKTSLKIIDQFASYCNEGNVNAAYNLLSEDCKNQMFPNADVFKTVYYDSVFNGSKKTITTENWVRNIYKVKFEENALASGTYNKNSAKQDYITIVTDSNGNLKLNVNSYIGKQEINKEMQTQNIKFKVVEKHMYMDYEIYEYEITNNNVVDVILNDMEAVGTLYLQDKNNITYSAYTHELTQTDLTVRSNETKKLSIKYYNKFISTKEIESIIFERVIINYAVYPFYISARIEL